MKRKILKPKPPKQGVQEESDVREAEVVEVLPAVLDDSSDVEVLDAPPFESLDEDTTLEADADSTSLVGSSVLQRYLSELRRYPLMNREEERETAILAYEFHDAEAKQKLVTANLRLVVKIAMEYRRAYAQMLDLIQEGNAGLVQAVNRFNPYKGVKLSTYGAWWIRAYILKFLMDNKSLVRMGTTDAQRKLFFRLRSEAEKMYALTQRFDAKLLAEKMGVEPHDVEEMQQRLSKNDLSLDTPIGDDDQARQVDIIPSYWDTPYERAEKSQLFDLLREGIDDITAELNERDAFIFHKRILAEEPLTLQEVGDYYGITRERARQLEAKLIKKLRKKLEKRGVLDADSDV